MKDFSRTASSELPTHFGPFRLVHYHSAELEGLALVRGNPTGDGVLCRIHSECMTGEVFGSLRCDCRAQLELAQERLSRASEGVIVYLRQEGRGIGLGNKIRAYALQDQGRDTVQANIELGFEVDERNYELAAAILLDLGITGVRLMTNNPEKLKGLSDAGIKLDEHVPHWAGASTHSEAYLETKRHRMGHITQSPVPGATTTEATVASPVGEAPQSDSSQTDNSQADSA
ncbi:MAG: GTP cyclohydrolase II [Myxococcales bacterium]|nr:GTP cyclohydrolase II [Myxococcales bacterium]